MVTMLPTVAHIPKMMPVILSVDKDEVEVVALVDVKFRDSIIRRNNVAIMVTFCGLNDWKSP